VLEALRLGPKLRAAAGLPSVIKCRFVGLLVAPRLFCLEVALVNGRGAIERPGEFDISAERAHGLHVGSFPDVAGASTKG
jgi:hypothetical protein